MSNLNGNQFELSIPPFHTEKPVVHSHSDVGSETPLERGLRVAREVSREKPTSHPFAQVGPVVKPAETIERKLPGGRESWTYRVPETRTVQPPLFMLPHELAYHSDLRDLGHDDSELDSHGMPQEHAYLENDTPEDLMRRKLYAPHPESADVAESVKEHGIHVPLEVSIHPHGGLKVEDGHHRLAAALAHRPNDFVPIDWENASHETPKHG